jgi:hypothetical protein
MPQTHELSNGINPREYRVGIPERGDRFIRNITFEKNREMARHDRTIGLSTIENSGQA